MAKPTLISISPASGPSSGGDSVTLQGAFASRVAVRFGDEPAIVISVRDEAGVSIAQVRTPAHAEAPVDVTLSNVDAVGNPLFGESIALAGVYRFLRPRIVREADLTRLIRALLRELKRQVIENVSLSVAIDFDDAPLDGLDVTAIAKLPSLVLSGPRIKENRFYSTNAFEEEIVAGASGPEIRRHRAPFTVDLEFAITGASDRAVELLNMMTAVAAFLDRNRWLSMDRDLSDPAVGSARWEMDASGELQTNLEGKDDVRAFTWGLVIRGFDIDEGLTIDIGRAVADAGMDIAVAPIAGGAS